MAESIGSTIEKLENEMSLAEFASWIDYFAYNARKESDAVKKAKSSAKNPARPNGYMGR